MALAVPTPAPKFRVIGDDWPFRVQFSQPSGEPMDLTGATVFADLYRANLPTPVVTLSIGSGAELVGVPTTGTVDFWVDDALTSTFAGQDVDYAGPNFPNRLVPYLVDGLGRERTAQIVPVVPVDRRTARVIPPADLDPVTIVVGTQGPAGTSSDFSGIAGTTISAHSVVGGTPAAVLPCDAATAAAALTALGIAESSAQPGGGVKIRQFGLLTDGSLNLAPGLPVFCGPGGALTQSVPAKPASAFLLQVGTALTPTTILVALQPPTLLA